MVSSVVAATSRIPTESSAVSDGDTLRLRAALAEHFQLVWRTVRGLGVSHGAADDTAQQAFLVLAARLETVPPGKERGFLVKTAVRLAANARRAERRRRETATDEWGGLVSGTPNPEELTAEKQRQELLLRMLDRLPSELRTVFVLFELEGLTSTEIAQLLDIPTGTAASRLRLARERFQAEVARLRQRLRHSGGTP